MASFVLDTHAALWWWRDSPLLGVNAVRAISASANEIFVSVTSALEVAIKYRIGKLDDIGDPAINYPRLMKLHGFQNIPVLETHAMTAGLLAGEHRDPFDRLIAAQALTMGATIITRDPAFAAFGCKVIW